MKPLLLSLLATVLALTATRAAEPPFDPTAQPAPKAALATMPADGAGIYRISLERVASPVTFVLWLEIADGRGVKAAVFPVQSHIGGWWPADASKLTLEGDRLHGTVDFSLVPPRTEDNYKAFWDKKASRSGEWSANKAYEPYTGEPEATATATLDLSCDGHRGRGTYSLVFQSDDKVQYANESIMPGVAHEGRAYLLRSPNTAMPADYQVELYSPYLLNDLPINWTKAGMYSHHTGPLFTRLAVQGAAVTTAISYSHLDLNQIDPLTTLGNDLAIDDGVPSGSFQVALPTTLDTPITLTISETFRIGPRLFGTVTATCGDVSQSGPAVGIAPGTAEEAFWIEKPGAKEWPWYQEVAADQALAEQAAAEALQPVMPGEPGQTGFWTWNSLANHHANSTISCIHPPSFDLKEVEGATSYRFDIGQDKGSRFSLSFTVEQPWRPFPAEVWAQMAPSDKPYRFTVTPLGADGVALDAPMLMGIQEPSPEKLKKGEVVTTSGWIEAPVPATGIRIEKRPPFHGIVQETDRSWREAALLLARVRRDQVAIPRVRVLSPYNFGYWGMGPQGDHGFSTGWSADVRQHLAYRAETTDPRERLWAEQMLDFTVASITAHLNGRRKAPYDYQQNTVLAHYAIEAACDAYRETGNDDFKAQALLAMGGVADLQVPNGSFATYTGSGRMYGGESPMPPEQWRGNIKFYRHYPTYATAELLYSFGRVRQDLDTDEFVEAEAKAYEWAMEHQVKARNWPLHVCHSHSASYPVWQHPQAAFQFIRYLLECAPEERRDVELAADIARWCEDFKIDWSRLDTGPGGAIFPRIPKRDRYNNEAMVNNIQAAVVFEMLYQATGDRLWRAKGEALAVAVVQAIGPDGRTASWSLNAANTTFGDPKIPHVSFCFGWAAHMLREYAALREADERQR